MEGRGILEQLEVLNLLEAAFSEQGLVNESPSEVFLLELLQGKLFPSNTG